MPLRRPNFLIVGVQKTGTTFLAQHLSEHSDVFFSTPKEPFFFNRTEVDKQDLRVYLAENFYGVAGERWMGEGSTNYFHHPHAINHIRRVLGPETHVIVCLRHPLERTLSHYLHDYRRKRRTGDEPIGSDEWRGYVSRSFYADRIRQWSKRFVNFKVLFFEDLVQSGMEFYAQAASFLDIKPQTISDLPVNEGLRLGWQQDRLIMTGTPGEGQVRPVFRRADLEALLQSFSADVGKTEELTGRDLGSWRQMPDFQQLGEKLAAARAG